MFRTLLLVSIAPFVIACQSTQQPAATVQPGMNDDTIAAPGEEEILEPTDGIDNEIGVNN